MIGSRFMLAWLSLSGWVSGVDVANVDMTFGGSSTFTWNGTYDWPDSPDAGSVARADFPFNDGFEHLWKINNGALVILTQSGGNPGGRFFPGQGGDGIMTFTSDAGSPGKLSARGSTFAAIKIGSLSGGGTVNVEGGVSVDSGWIFGEGSDARQLNVTDGEFAVFSDNVSKRLNNIAVSIGVDGLLWIQDPSGSVTDTASFQSFASGSSLSATGGTLVFTNAVTRSAIAGGSVVGTEITVEPTSPDLEIATFHSFGVSVDPSVLVVPFENPSLFGELLLVGEEPVAVLGEDSGFFSVVGFDSQVGPNASGEIQLSFDSTGFGGGIRSYSATLQVASNDLDEPIKSVTLQVNVYAQQTGLVSHFTFDGSNDVAGDIGSFKNDGTVVGNAAFSADSRVGSGALALDGNGDLIDLGISSGADYTSGMIGDGDGFTAAFWAFIPSSAASGFTRVFSSYMPTGFVAQGWSVGLATQSRLLGTTYGKVDYFAASRTAPLRDEWHHFAYVFRGDPVSQVDYYIDGSLVQSVSSGNSGVNPANGVGFAIGCLGVPGNTHFVNGRLDDLRIYDRELGPREIEDLILPETDPFIRVAESIDLGERSDFDPHLFTVEVENRGVNQSLEVSEVSFSGSNAARFSVVTDLASPVVVGPSGVEGIELLFDSAGQVGDFFVQLEITSNDPERPLVSVPLSVAVVPPPLKAALLFVHAHADDESIFGGGVLPYYAQVRGLQVGVVSLVTRNPNGTSPITAGSTSRINELRNALDIYAGESLGSGFLGRREYLTGNLRQVLGGFTDTGCCSVPPDDSWSDAGDGFGWGLSSGAGGASPGFGNLEGIADGRSASVRVIAREIRRFRPEVVVTPHDLEGDYGHSNHTAAAIAVIDAFTLAADEGVAIDGLAPWQAKKLYLRGGSNDNRSQINYTFLGPLFPSSFASDGGLNSMFHDFFEEPSINGASPRQVADLGLNQHFSQGSPDVSTVFRSGESFDSHHSEWWTLYRSEVGSDDLETAFSISGDTTGSLYSGWARGDFFDGITVFPDGDEDGISDGWEQLNFGSRNGADANADEDSDGRTNLEEFVMGLDPTSPDRIPLTIDPINSLVSFVIPAAVGPGLEFLDRTYRLRFSSDMIDWSLVVSEGVASGLLQSHVIGAGGESGSKGFYRLELELR